MSSTGYSAAKSGYKKSMITPNLFDIKNWSNKEIDFTSDKLKDAKMLFCFGNYDYSKDGKPSQLCLRTDEVQLVTYGIPSLGQYAKTDKDREYIKFPFDKSQKSSSELFSVFSALDKWAVDNKDKIINGKIAKFAHMYEYQPIVRTPTESMSLDDEDDGKDKKEKMSYAKIKIDTDYESGDVKTVVYLREGSTPVKQNVKTITDLAELMPWRSKIRCVISCNKIWISRNPGSDGKRRYGLSFKVNQIEITEKAASGGASLKNDFSIYAFDDEVEIEKADAPAKAPVETKPEVKPEVKPEKKTKSDEKIVLKDDSSSEESSADDESSVESSASDESEESSEKKKPAPKPRKNAKK